MSMPRGHQYLVAVTSHHPHIFCPVIQELDFRLCLQICLCPHPLDGPQTYTGGVLSPNLHHGVVFTPFSAPTPAGPDWTPWKDVLNNPCLVWDCQWALLAAPALPNPSDLGTPRLVRALPVLCSPSAPGSFPHVEQPWFCCMLPWEYLA